MASQTQLANDFAATGHMFSLQKSNETFLNATASDQQFDSLNLTSIGDAFLEEPFKDSFGESHSKGWDTLSSVLGWISFVLWSLSFYPQSWQNYKSKSVAGFSVEFAMLNPAGFYFYTVYNLQGVVDPNIGNTGQIDVNDIFFAIHAFLLASVQLTQIFMYDRGKQPAVNYWIVAFLVIEFTIVIILYIIEVLSPDKIDQNWATIRTCGYCKAAITLIKYMPQVYLNWKRQSTVGWSLENVLLDFGGGAFSFGQQLVDSVARGKPLFGDSSDSGFNIVKFLLSVLAMFFDIIFMFQHYVLYRDKWQSRDNQLKRIGKMNQLAESFKEMDYTNNDSEPHQPGTGYKDLDDALD